MSKRRKQKQVKKPRSLSLRVDFGVPNIEIARLEHEDNIFSFYDNHGKQVFPKSIEVGTEYKRDNPNKSSKFLNLAKADEKNIITDINTILLSFNIVFAIDTNSLDLNDEKISVSCPINFWGGANGENQSIEYKQHHSLEFRNAKVNPELIGWCYLIKYLMEPGYMPAGTRIAIIVDSELDRLNAINSRIEPILDDFFLPVNYQLIYASSDVGKDNVVNKMISICDTKGKSILKIFKDSNDRITKPKLLTSTDPNYTNYIYWTVRNEKVEKFSVI